MAGVKSKINVDTSFINLGEIPIEKVRPEVWELLVDGENVIQCFMTIRDQVIFTNKRVFVINVQGLTGTKIAYFSYPYSKVLYFGIETAGFLGIDSELIMTYSNGTVLHFDFHSKVDIKAICVNIQQYIL